MPRVTPIEYAHATTSLRRAKRLEYTEAQHGKCWICGAPLVDAPDPSFTANNPVRSDQLERLFPPGFLHNPVHLHHDQRTGLTLGAVHALCNAAEWIHRGR